MRRTHGICLSVTSFILLICCLHFPVNNMTSFPFVLKTMPVWSYTIFPTAHLQYLSLAEPVLLPQHSCCEHGCVGISTTCWLGGLWEIPRNGDCLQHGCSGDAMRGWQWAQKKLSGRVSCKGYLSLDATRQPGQTDKHHTLCFLLKCTRSHWIVSEWVVAKPLLLPGRITAGHISASGPPGSSLLPKFHSPLNRLQSLQFMETAI